MNVSTLIDKSKAAGFTIKRQGRNLHIYKQDRRNGAICQGVWITLTDAGAFDNAIRTDIDLATALAIRIVSQCARILDLKP